MTHIYEQGLPKTTANFVALSPVSFVERSAEVFGDLTAVIHGARRYDWRTLRDRSARLAAALRSLGVGRLDTVSVMLPNTPEMIEAHYAVPALNAVLNTLNTRLDAALLAWQMAHCEAKVLITDREFAPTTQAALRLLREEHGRTPVVIDVADSEYTGAGDLLGVHEYEALLAAKAPLANLAGPLDEWDAIAVSYTSGTTGDPKGVVTHHRGAYLNGASNVISWQLPHHATYLWTLPMFHCNGWCFPWTMALIAGTSVCLRRVDPALIFPLIREHHITHLCGAPIVYSMLINAPAGLRSGINHAVNGLIAGAAPPAAVIEGCEAAGIILTHVYGLTEVYGPAAVCAKQASWAALSIEERARLNGRQGVAYPLQEAVTVLDPETLLPVPADGETMGEIFFRGNVVMKGYLKNPSATEEAFEGGWFHTGDLAVMYPDNYIKIKDRSKDIIISGGENISSIEVEDALHRHPAVMLAAVVAQPDKKWGEVPCAFVELKPGEAASEAEIVEFCRNLLARFKVPKRVHFCTLPKTSTGKIQKFMLRDQVNSTKAIE